jgi:hypothetical protein
MDIHALYGVLLPRFRRRRMERFLATFRPSATTRILDLGGTPFNWTTVACPAQVTLLNLDPPAEGALPANLAWARGDATALEYADGAFDICFSNSVVEHLGSRERQERFAREAGRVAGRLWIQTPARCFPVEPHLITPFVHYLPRALQRRALRNLTVWGLITRPGRREVDEFLASTRLLDLGEMRSLFPDCRIARERFVGLTKAYVAVRE